MKGSNIKIRNMVVCERWAASIDLAVSIRFGGQLFFFKNLMKEVVDLSGQSFTNETCAAVVHLWGHASAQMYVQEPPMEPADLWNCGRCPGCSYEERVSPKWGWGTPIDSGWSCEENKNAVSLSDMGRNTENRTAFDGKDMDAWKNLKVGDNLDLVMALAESVFQRVTVGKILEVDCPAYFYLSGHFETNLPERRRRQRREYCQWCRVPVISKG